MKLFSSEDCPSKVGLKSPDHLQARTSSMLHPYTVESNDCPPGFDVTHMGNQLTDLSCIPLIKWNYPPKVSTVRYFPQMPKYFSIFLCHFASFSDASNCNTISIWTVCYELPLACGSRRGEQRGGISRIEGKEISWGNLSPSICYSTLVIWYFRDLNINLEAQSF